jgi:hypothetical protein
MKLTQCPKCEYKQVATGQCANCGLVFRKYFKYHPQHTSAEIAEFDPDKNSVVTPSDLIRSNQTTPNNFRLVKFAFIALLFFTTGQMLFAGINGETLIVKIMHLISLPFHEAGHLLLRPAGQFISSLGGTLGQLIVPLVCAYALWFKQHDQFGSMIAIWWFGQNFVDISPYIFDARAGQLPLLGGNFGHSSPYGFHDWEYLLTETGLINADHTIASLSFGLGIIIMLCALALSCYFNKKLSNKKGD